MAVGRYVALVMVALMVASAVSCRTEGAQAVKASSNGKKYDGGWWLSVSSAEQSGFLDGLADCYGFELKGKFRYARSAQENQQFVTRFYDDPYRRKLPVFEVFLQALDHPSEVKRPEGGEVWDEPHGYWDGLWWKGGTEPELALSQKGFVEGYLWCYAEKAHSPRGTFSKSPENYVTLITKWYEETGREEEKIADVLFKLRDNPAPRNRAKPPARKNPTPPPKPDLPRR